MRRLKILTWHVHGSYLWYLSRAPHDFYVPVKTARPIGYVGRGCGRQYPANVVEIPVDRVRELDFDCVLFQSQDNWLIDQYQVLSDRQRELPRIFLEHHLPRQSPAETLHPVDDPNVLIVHVSHLGELLWDNSRTSTKVIEPGVVVPDEVRSTFELERGLVVMNNIMGRERRLGGDLFRAAREEVPLDLVGRGWREAGGLGQVPHSELPSLHARYRFHFWPARWSNPTLSLCEAMMIGQPIVAVSSGEIPGLIESGESGYVDTRLESLIAFMRLLLRDPSLARKLGDGARRVALERFSIDRFVREWNEAFALVTGETAKPRKRILPARRSSMRIAFVSESASPLMSGSESGPGASIGLESGGQAVYVTQLARQLARQGIEVDVFTRKSRRDLPAVAEWEDGVRVVHVEAGPAGPLPKDGLFMHMPAFVGGMEKYCRASRRKYDLVHANFWTSAFVGVEIRRRLNLPVVVSFHSLGKVRRHYLGAADRSPEVRVVAEKWVADEADAVIASCPQEREDLIAQYAAKPSRLAMIPFGFDPREMFPIDKRTARRHLAWDQDAKVCLFLGRLLARKGADLVVRGFARALKLRREKARLVIVAAGTDTSDPLSVPEIASLLKLAHEEGIADSIQFTGHVSDRTELKYLYSAADVFVSTPWFEPFGLTALEAMACGTPVLGSRVGGIKYTVTEGESGLLISPGDVTELGDKLESLLHDNRLRERMARTAFERAHRHFRWDVVASQVAKLYETTLSRHERRKILKLVSASPDIPGS